MNWIEIPQLTPAQISSMLAGETIELIPSPGKGRCIVFRPDMQAYKIRELPLNFFQAWSQSHSDGPIPTQTFSCDARQSRQFVDWYVKPADLEFARAHPGQLYIIGDEPDQFCQPPSQYAETYHMAVEAIRAVDPTARFSPAGFAEVNGHCCLSTEYSPCWEAVHSINYAQRFLDAYRIAYNATPPVAEWRFHDFATRYPSGALEDWWKRIDSMAAWSVAHGAPMVLGSWGFLGWRESDVDLIRAAQLLLADERIVGAVWWSLEPWEETTHPLIVNGVLTPIGEIYAKLSGGNVPDENTQRIAALEKTVGALLDRLSKVEATAGVRFVGLDSSALAAALKDPRNQLEGQRWPLFLSDFEIRVGIKKIEDRLPPAAP